MTLDFAWIGLSNSTRNDPSVQARNVEIFIRNFSIALRAKVNRYIDSGCVAGFSELFTPLC